MAAMREPKARPSKVWWKEIAISRTRKGGPVATERAMPMKMEWKRMPASRSRHWRRSFWSRVCCERFVLLLVMVVVEGYGLWQWASPLGEGPEGCFGG